ncbi:MAG: shikimate kinase [Archaeoglobales archaeon]|jgi:shikimate kinase|nr:shikimate kinase [Archaeoglobales archaeon]
MRAKAYAAGTVLNALATGIGCAFGINLILEVKIRPSDENVLIVNGKERGTEVLEKVLNFFSEKLRVIVKSEIPERSGLGSSSAFLNALLSAIMKKNDKKLFASEILRVNADLSLKAGISYTGAFDDASASLLGGFVISENYRRALREWFICKGYAAVLIPNFQRGKVDWETIKRESQKLGNVEEKLRRHDFCEVMRKNTVFYCSLLGYPIDIAERLWKEGICCGLSGNGPSFVAIGDRSDVIFAKEIWSEFGKVLIKKISEKPAEEVLINRELFI